VTYSQAMEILSMYAGDLMPEFADPWCRWPAGAAAYSLAEDLDRRAAGLEHFEAAAAALANLAETIRARAAE